VARPGGLGKGLGALIPTSESTPVVLEPSSSSSAATGLMEIAVTAIKPNPYQPRQHFDEEALGALADSIGELGVLQPILVRPDGTSFVLIAGERRWRAAQRAGLSTIPALVRDADNSNALAQAIVENVQREQLNPLEEAAAYHQLIDDFSLTHDDVARRVGKSRASVSNTLRLMQLPPTIQRFVRDGTLRMGHARALLATPDRAFQEQLARKIVAEDLSVRAVENAIRDHETDPTEAATAKLPSSRLRPPGLLELEELLSDYLDTRVSVSMTDRKGKVTIEFATLEDLERIYRVMTEGGRH
jgi:ParB family transcriptional regulator, chromosome partitioning protein